VWRKVESQRDGLLEKALPAGGKEGRSELSLREGEVSKSRPLAILLNPKKEKARKASEKKKKKARFKGGRTPWSFLIRGRKQWTSLDALTGPFWMQEGDDGHLAPRRERIGNRPARRRVKDVLISSFWRCKKRNEASSMKKREGGLNTVAGQSPGCAKHSKMGKALIKGRRRGKITIRSCWLGRGGRKKTQRESRESIYRREVDRFATERKGALSLGEGGIPTQAAWWECAALWQREEGRI